MKRALALVVLFASRALADEGIDHTVKAGDTCAGIATRYYGDARFVEVLHRANPALGSLPPPHVLKEGTVLHVPPRPATNEAPDARLTTVRNRVDVLAPETRPGKPKDPLFRGNRVSTEASSSADVTFRDESMVLLGERTLVVILGDARSAAAKADAPPIETSLVTGNLRAFLAQTGKTKAPLAVQTPAAAIKVREGEAQVGSDDKKTARLSVYAGNSTISAQGTTREVVPGFGSKAELGKAPTVPKPLPLAPRWTKLPQRVVLFRGTPSPAKVETASDAAPSPAKVAPTTPSQSAAASDAAPSPAKVGASGAIDGRGATDAAAAETASAPAGSVEIFAEFGEAPGSKGHPMQWHVQVGRDDRFRDLVVDTKVPLATTRFEGRAPAPGQYWIRVSAMDDDHFEGPFSDAARVLVVHPVITAEDANHRRVEIFPANAPCMRIGNTRLTWVKAPIVAETLERIWLRCAPAETDPTMLLDLDHLEDFPTPQ